MKRLLVKKIKVALQTVVEAKEAPSCSHGLGVHCQNIYHV
jgi:hypothetical protein